MPQLIDESTLKEVAQFIEEAVGIIYEGNNLFQLEKRIPEMMWAAGALSPKDLVARLERGLDRNCRQAILDIATNNETLFFRDERVFSALKEVLIPTLWARHPHVRIWSSCCSTGQEVYSLAIISEEVLEKMSSGFRYSIVASDVSERALVAARNGRYSQLQVERGLSGQRLEKYFVLEQDERWSIHPKIKRNIEFKLCNLLEASQSSDQFDLVLCRNMLIYQRPENRKRIVNKLVKHLKPEGYLLVGGSESLLGLSDELKMESLAGTIVYKKED